jgi:hypothetical protein
MGLVEGGLSESDAERKYHLRPGTINRWFEAEDFKKDMLQVIRTANLRAQILVARSAVAAARQLVELTKCQKEETRRKACLSIIELAPWKTATDETSAEEAPSLPPGVSEKTAHRLLEVLAEDGEEEEEEECQHGRTEEIAIAEDHEEHSVAMQQRAAGSA